MSVTPKSFKIFLALIIMNFVAIPQTPATTLVMMDEEEKTDRAHDIIMGELELVEPEWIRRDDGHDVLYTVLYFRISKVLKSHCSLEVGDLFPVYRIGGKIVGLDMQAVGSPRFALNATYVIFSQLDVDYKHRLVGFNLGKYRAFRQKSQPGGYLCLMDKGTVGAHILDPQTGKQVQISDQERRISLGNLENKVNKVLQGETP